mmetsp:Transcript_25546/g.76183  ORF Transcript_25546/g.76183 Transcript_25546/m.76183 type:complete len:165 (+) Transcript_25546:69-563(+)
MATLFFFVLFAVQLAGSTVHAGSQSCVGKQCAASEVLLQKQARSLAADATEKDTAAEVSRVTAKKKKVGTTKPSKKKTKKLAEEEDPFDVVMSGESPDIRKSNKNKRTMLQTRQVQGSINHLDEEDGLGMNNGMEVSSMRKPSMMQQQRTSGKLIDVEEEPVPF